MLRRFDTNFVVIMMAMDAAVVWLAWGLVETWRPSLLWLPFSQRVDSVDYVPTGLHLAVTLLWIMVFFALSLYDPQQIFRIVDELRILIQGSVLAGLASAGLIYLSFRDVSRWSFLVFVVLTIGLLFAWRIASRLTLVILNRPPRSAQRVLVLGAGPVGLQIERLIDAHRWTGLVFVGFVDEDQFGNHEGAAVLGGFAKVREIVQEHRVDEVVVTPPYSDSWLDAIVNTLLDLPLHIRVVPTSFALASERAAIENFAGIAMIDLRAGPLSEYQRVVKRTVDLAIGFALTLAALPLMGAIAIAIKCLGAPGTLLFKQTRVGENGRLFTMFKFRTMVDNAETLRDGVITRDDRGNLVHKHPDDPRCTRIGRFLRRTSLDELPQLFNVLKGDMSLVGPRPELPWLVAEYAPWQRRRLIVPQGLTGWWQVNGRSDRTMHLNTDVDLYYVSHYSFWLDLWIIWKTFWVVLLGKGAH